MPLHVNNVIENRKETKEEKDETEDRKEIILNNRIICAACQSDPADLMCNSCPSIIYFCDTCFAFLHKSGPNKSHIPGQISDLNLKEKADLKVKLDEEINNCTNHKSRKLEYFCEKCSILICSDCLISRHKGHDAVKVEDKEKEIRKRIEIDKRNCEEINMKICKIMGKIQDKKSEISQVLFLLQEDSIKLIERLQEALTKKKAELIYKTQEKCEPNFEQLTFLESHLDSVNVKLIEHISTLENCCKEKNIIPIYLNILKEKSSHILNILGNFSPFSNEFFIFTETKFIRPSLNSFDLENVISKIDFLEGPYNSQEYNDKIIFNNSESSNLLIKNPSNNTNTNSKNPFRFCLDKPENRISNIFTLCNFLNQHFNLLSPIKRQNVVHPAQIMEIPDLRGAKAVKLLREKVEPPFRFKGNYGFNIQNERMNNQKALNYSFD